MFLCVDHESTLVNRVSFGMTGSGNMALAATGDLSLIKENGKKTVLISLNLPYDAACYEDTDAVLCAYQPYGSAHDAEGNGPFNLNVAVALCTAYSRSVPSGTLPVNVPKITVNNGEIVFEDEYLYSRGYGLANWGE